jgi:hypothetical protein
MPNNLPALCGAFTFAAYAPAPTSTFATIPRFSSSWIYGDFHRATLSQDYQGVGVIKSQT